MLFLIYIMPYFCHILAKITGQSLNSWALKSWGFDVGPMDFSIPHLYRPGTWVAVAPTLTVGMISNFIELPATAVISASTPKILLHIVVCFSLTICASLKSLLNPTVPVFVLGAKDRLWWSKLIYRSWLIGAGFVQLRQKINWVI